MRDRQQAALNALSAARTEAPAHLHKIRSLHPYPGMLARHIPQAILSGRWPAIRRSDLRTVLDPFCGAGSVLLASQLSGHNTLGWDSNPLACLISRAKTQPLSKATALNELRRVVLDASECTESEHPDVVNIDYWYSKQAKDGLSRLAATIGATQINATTDLLRVALSKTALKFSLADPRIPVPVRLKLKHYRHNPTVYRQLEHHLTRAKFGDPIRGFYETASADINLLTQFQAKHSEANGVATVYEHDARTHYSTHEPIEAIITSPPYPGAQKYTRFSSLSLGWLRFCDNTSLRAFEEVQIGREHYSKHEYTSDPLRTGVPAADGILQAVAAHNPLRAHIGAVYLLELRQTMKHLADLLEPCAHLIMITAASSFAGLRYDTPKYVAHIARDEGFDLFLEVNDAIRTRRLSASRAGNQQPISRESIMHFRRSP